MDTSVDGLLKLKTSMETEHTTFKQEWEQIIKFVRYDSSDMYSKQTRGESKTVNQFNGTAVWAHSILSSFMLGSLTPSTDRWFALGVQGHKLDNLDKDIKQWLEDVENILYNHYANPYSYFYQCMHETIDEDTSVGTSVAFHDWDEEYKTIRYESIPINNVRLAESRNGLVDIVNQEKVLNYRQISQEYSEDELYMAMDADQRDKFKKMLYDRPLDELTIQRFVYPAKEGDIKRRGFKYSSDHILEDYKVRIRKSGYHTFPYNVNRWKKVAGETYGRGPAHVCIRDIRMLNMMDRTLSRYAQHQADPTLILPYEGIMGPFSFNPHGRVFTKPGVKIDQMSREGNIAFTDAYFQAKANQITRAFFVDWIIQAQNNVEKTKHEIIDKRNEQFFLLAATISRFNAEKTGRLLERDIDILNRRNLLPDFPEVESFKGQTAVIRPMYMSPAVRAQQYLKAAAANQWIDQTVKLSSIDRRVAHYADLGRYTQVTGEYSGVPQEIMRTQEEAEQLFQKEQEEIKQAQQRELQIKELEAGAKLTAAQAQQQ